MRIASIVALVIIIAVPASVLDCGDTGTPDTRIEAVRGGLSVFPRYVAGDPASFASLEDRMAALHVPGAQIAVIENWRIDWSAGFGLREAGSPAGVTADTPFQAASISKPVAAATALALVRSGRLDLDSPVDRYLRSWRIPPGDGFAADEVTLRRLLGHTAGTTVGGFPGYAAGAPLPSLIQVLDGDSPANTPPVKLARAPGTEISYSGGGYVIVQLLIEDVTRTPFYEVAKALILDETGMRNSSFRQPPDPGIAATAASGHDEEGRPIPGRWHVYPEAAAAGLWTTAADVAAFAIEIGRAARGKSRLVLDRELAGDMLRRQEIGDRAEPYGLGLAIEGEGRGLRVSHSGVNRGYRALFVLYPATGQGAVVMTNGAAGMTLAVEIVRAVARVYGWPSDAPAEVRTVRLAETDLDRLAGKYGIDGLPGSVVEIARAGDHLALSGPGISLTLHPVSESRFAAIEERVDLLFETGAGGAVSFRAIGGEIPPLTGRRIP
ncbi:MAG: beta-lactamase family protein [Candidatus Krumholzibacteriota bacterium]|nr:beta-lactamase family protein [Candidatus Krumholzibacteriota bacterium]